MAYTNVLSLADAKTYLKVEHTDTDDEITAMINAACEYLEDQTGHIFYSRNKTYPLADKLEINVYDYPITAVVKAIDEDDTDITLTFQTNYDVTEYTLHTKYYNLDADAVSLVLTVGYATATDVPRGLVEAAKMIVKALYYSVDAETIDDALPLTAKMLINNQRRFHI